MTKAIAGLFISLGFLVPAFASASVSITSVTLNGGSAVQVNPGATITVAVTTTLTDSSKWKGVNWGVNAGSMTTTCVNTKNAKEGTRNNDTGVFVETFTIKAPGQPGLYNANFLADIANNCGKPAGNTFTLSQAVRVGPVPPPPPSDTQAPVIAAHADVHATTTGTSASVSYAAPTATDNVDASVAVSCAPASGSVFNLGETTVTCNAHDAANNMAQSSFKIILEQEAVLPPAPTLYTMAGQIDESYLCGVDNASWRYCDADGTFSFADMVGEGVKTISLGLGSSMGGGALQTVTIARDEHNPFTPTNPWLVSLTCYTDASYSSACTDWVAPTAANGNRTDSIKEFAASSQDSKHWVADFTHPVRERNFDGTSPVTFNPGYYYQLVIDDVGFDTAAYGSESLQEPYWVVTGMH